jgi:hypothetical protein
MKSTKPTIQNLARLFRQKFYLPVFTLLISIVAAAQVHPNRSPVVDRKEINVSEPFQQIEVRGNVNVILTNAPAGYILLEGNYKDIGHVETILGKGKVVIDAQEKQSFSNLNVYVSSANLSSLTINGDGDVRSLGTVKTSELELILNGIVGVEVRNEGKVKVIPGEGYDLLGDIGNTKRRTVKY